MLAGAAPSPILLQIAGKLERSPCRFREMLHIVDLARISDVLRWISKPALAANHPLG